jgi:hypothetical protein
MGWMRIDGMLDPVDDMHLRIASDFDVSASMNPGDRRVRVMEKGIIVELFDCPFASLPYNMCDGHLIKDGGLGLALLTSYEVRHVKRQTWGDDRCVHIIRNAPASGEDWDDCGQELATMLPPPLTKNEMGMLEREMAAGLWVAVIEACVDGLGPLRVEEDLAPLMNRSGKAAGMRFSSMIGSAGGRNVQIADLLLFYGEVMKMKVEPWTKEGFDGTVSSCPFRSSSPTVCALFDAFVEGLCQSVDPSYRMEATKLECGECSLCHWAITRD